MKHRPDEITEKLIDKVNRLSADLRRAETRERPVIVARYSTNAGQSIADITTAVINFEDSEIDTRSAVATGAGWTFTAPLGGYYAVSALVTFAASATWATTEHARLLVYKNGSAAFYLDRRDGLPAASVMMSLTGSGVISLAKDDAIDVRVYQNSGGAITLQADNQLNWISVYRL